MDPIPVTLILHDSNPLGIRTAEIGNSVIHAAVIPRALWKSAKDLKNLQNPGVYFLASTQKDDTMYDVYVGQSENVSNRVTQHANKLEKDFWNYVICFTSKDGSMNNTHAMLLESMLCKLVKNIGRSNVQNGTEPQTRQVSSYDGITVQKFLNDIQTLLAVLGFPILIPRFNQKKKNIYYCKGPLANARGSYTEEGFLVFKDSIARKKWAPSVKGELSARQQLVDERVLEDRGESYRFARDYLFPTPSRAAVFVLARAANGWTEWEDENGKTLDANERIKSEDAK